MVDTAAMSRRTDAPKPPHRPQLALPEPLPVAEPALAAGGDYDAVLFDGADLTGAAAPGVRLLDCVLRACVLDEADLGRARLLDTVLQAPRGVGAVLADAVLRDVELLDARLGGVRLSGAELNRVLVRGGKIDYLNLRQARLIDVTFRECVLVEPDFAGARLERVAFEDCELRGADFTQATLRDVDLRAAMPLEVTRGIDRLAGAAVTPSQLLDLAPALAAHLGLRVVP